MTVSDSKYKQKVDRISWKKTFGIEILSQTTKNWQEFDQEIVHVPVKSISVLSFENLEIAKNLCVLTSFYPQNASAGTSR